MKKLIIAILLIFAKFVTASTPITCTALSDLGYKYMYFGFTGTSTDTFTIAHSNDDLTWTNLGGSWPSCGNGSPCKVNSPSAVCYKNNLYLLIAEANDSNYNSTVQDIGVLNTDYSVTTLLTFDWASLGSVSTIFAGRWEAVSGSTNCFTTPVTFSSGFFSWSTYQACASLTPTSASITSGPTLLTNTGAVNGMYDTQVIQQGSTCNLVGSQTNSGLTFRTAAISTGACPAGPFTWQTNAATGGSPLAAQSTVSTQNEGPNYLQTNNAGGWYFYFESISPTHVMYGANCTPVTISSCTISTPVAWTEDQTYRAGTILKMTTGTFMTGVVTIGTVIQ